MKLKTKIHLFSTLLMLVILTLTNTGIYFVYEKLAYDTEYNQLKTQSQDLIASLSQMTEKTNPATVLHAYRPPNGAVRILGPTGKLKVESESAEGIRSYHPEIKPGERYSIGEFDNTPILTMREPVIWTDGKVVELQTIQLLSDVKHNLSLLKLILFGVTLIAMIPITISSVALGRIVIQPIDNLIKTMSQSRQTGTYEKIEVPAEGKDEMAQMGHEFNDMMGQLESNFKKQEQFVSNASHELKTPLTVIESYARLLSRRGFDDLSVAKEAVGAILGESIRMKDMIEQMLHLARNQEHVAFKFEETDINSLVEKTLQPMRQAHARDFILEGNGSVVVVTDAEKLRQLLFILLDNARKYSEREIKTTISENETAISITVTDYGNGIPKEALPHIFDRFYRVHEDRNRKTGGTGLGLAIAKELADGLGAELNLESSVGVGTTFRIIMPKKQILTDF
ncbi:HAMP domain-containing sensor histidine kinase [Sporosarcina psychrophila]|uniref:sensor histidine kinase n=1 Tax=Sporosarcina psychrophila TaxID=1476 RepID=UPI0030CE46AE